MANLNLNINGAGKKQKPCRILRRALLSLGIIGHGIWQSIKGDQSRKPRQGRVLKFNGLDNWLDHKTKVQGSAPILLDIDLTINDTSKANTIFRCGGYGNDVTGFYIDHYSNGELRFICSDGTTRQILDTNIAVAEKVKTNIQFIWNGLAGVHNIKFIVDSVEYTFSATTPWIGESIIDFRVGDSSAITVSRYVYQINNMPVPAIFNVEEESGSTLYSTQSQTLYSEEKLVDGDLSEGDVNWSIAGESTVPIGSINIYSSIGDYTAVAQANVFTLGLMYRVSYEVFSKLSGSLASNRLNSGGEIPSELGLNVISNYIATSASIDFKRLAGATDIRIGNISVVEVFEPQTLTVMGASGEASGFHAIDNTKALSKANDIGYSELGDAIIPIDPITGLDVKGNTPRYTGEVAYNATMGNYPCTINNNADNVIANPWGLYMAGDYSYGGIFKPRDIAYNCFGGDVVDSWYLKSGQLYYNQVPLGVYMDSTQFYTFFANVSKVGSDGIIDLFINNEHILTFTEPSYIQTRIYSLNFIRYKDGVNSVTELACTYLAKNAVTFDQALNWKGQPINGGANEILIPFLGTQNATDVNSNTVHTFLGATVGKGNQNVYDYLGMNGFGFRPIFDVSSTVGYTESQLGVIKLNETTFRFDGLQPNAVTIAYLSDTGIRKQRTYKVFFRISNWVNGDARIIIGGYTSTQSYSGNGYYEDTVTTISDSTNSFFYIRGNLGFQGDISEMGFYDISPIPASQLNPTEDVLGGTLTNPAILDKKGKLIGVNNKWTTVTPPLAPAPYHADSMNRLYEPPFLNDVMDKDKVYSISNHGGSIGNIEVLDNGIIFSNPTPGTTSGYPRANMYFDNITTVIDNQYRIRFNYKKLIVGDIVNALTIVFGGYYKTIPAKDIIGSIDITFTIGGPTVYGTFIAIAANGGAVYFELEITDFIMESLSDPIPVVAKTLTYDDFPENESNYLYANKIEDRSLSHVTLFPEALSEKDSEKTNKCLLTSIPSNN